MQNFTELFNYYLDRQNLGIGQMVQRLADNGMPISRDTLNNWKSGKTQKPRYPEDILKLARAFGLNEAETSTLLRAAGHPAVDELRQRGEHTAMLSYWDTPHQAPPPPPFFVGREEEMAQLTQALTAESRPVALIHGMGGVGKTTLAAELAHRLSPAFPDGILWADLEQYNPMALLSSFVRAYGEDVSEYTELTDRRRVVRDILARKKVLLVLDNVQKETELTAFLPIGGKAATLITTRSQNLWAARFARASVLLKPFDAERQESLELFAQLLGEAVRQEAEMTLTEIANSVGHLPLALDIVANRLVNEPGWDIDRFWARLRQEKRRLDLLSYNESVGVRLSLNVSFEALEQELQHFFVQLGAFDGIDFDVAAVTAVTQTPTFTAHDRLTRLYMLSLLQTGQARDRFRLHPLLRAFAREKLQDATPVKRMAHHYVAYAVDNASAYEALDAEYSNLEAALAAAWIHECLDELVDGAKALCAYWETCGLYETAMLHLERAQEVARRLENPLALAQMLRRNGRLAVRQGSYDRARRHYLEGLEIVRGIDALSLVCALEQSLGALAARQGQMQQAQDWTEKALAKARQLADDDRTFDLLNNLGGIMLNSGQLSQAQRYYQEALPYAQALEGQTAVRRQCILLRNLGRLASDLGEHVQAAVYYERAWDLATAQDDQNRLCDLLDNMGYEQFLAGNLEEAERQFKQGLKIARNIHAPLFICRQRANLGLLDVALGRYAAAQRHFEDALQLAQDMGATWDICLIHNRWGECYLAEEVWEEAEAQFQAALQAAKEAGFREHEAQAYWGLAQAAANLGMLDAARVRGRKSVKQFGNMQHRLAGKVERWLQALPETV
jgi:tetratricopeptide (TPR) repeat protein